MNLLVIVLDTTVKGTWWCNGKILDTHLDYPRAVPEQRSQGSLVSIETRLPAGRPQFDSQQG
jgi:hypothetical protein